jgi:membrane protein implicated in regulation of membrane protease activity
LLTRPLAVKKLNVGKSKTNVDALCGMTGVVVRSISRYDRGEVKVGGQIWTAVSESDIEKGCEVVIERIEGVKAVVSRRLIN